MIDQKSKKIAALLVCAVILGGGFCSIMAQTSTVAAKEQQNPIIYYSLVPTLLMLNVVTPSQISNDSTLVLKPPVCELVILRISARD